MQTESNVCRKKRIQLPIDASKVCIFLLVNALRIQNVTPEIGVFLAKKPTF
jgi:hypothetical protein